MTVRPPGHFNGGAGHFRQRVLVADGLRPRRADDHAVLQAESLGEGDAGLVKLLAPDQARRPGIVEDTLEFIDGEPPIEADHHRTELAAAIQHLDVIRRTVRQHGHPVARIDLPALAQKLGEAARPFVELGIADATSAVKIHQGDLVGKLP